MRGTHDPDGSRHWRGGHQGTASSARFANKYRVVKDELGRGLLSLIEFATM